MSVHTHGEGIGVGRERAAQTRQVSRLQRALQDWINADPAYNARDLARAAGLSPSVIYALRSRPLKRQPDDATITALAGVLPISESELRYMIAIDLGLLPDPGEDADLTALHRRLVARDPKA